MRTSEHAAPRQVGGDSKSEVKTFTLLSADGETYESATQGTLGGVRNRKVYGELTCPSALRAIAKGGPYGKHRVFFADEATAVAAGYRPCGTCMRKKYDAWKRR